jgi:membrane-associated phospholipid phosphatase
MSLPLFLTPKNKYPIGIAVGILITASYLSSNHVHFLEPKLLPLSTVDQSIPFIPETVWIYISDYLFCFIVYVLCKNLINLNKYLYAFLALQAGSILIFLLWPTTYPRELFPLPSSLDGLTYQAFQMLRKADTPMNCCPSLHVSSVYLCSFNFLKEQREKFRWFLGWATAVAISTLTTKQHYLIDVVTGLAIALASYWIFFKKVTYRSI